MKSWHDSCLSLVTCIFHNKNPVTAMTIICLRLPLPTSRTSFTAGFPAEA